MSDLVLYQLQPPAAVLTLNRADKRNALSRGLIAGLAAAFEKARDDPAARCVILTGAGPVFCAGMDLAELAEALQQPAENTPVWEDALRLARYLLLTGEVIDAGEAQRCGLINAVAAAEQLMPRAAAWAHALAAGGPHALARTKELLHQFSRQALSVVEAATASAAPRLTEECQQGLRAFFAKQPAPWAPR